MPERILICLFTILAGRWRRLRVQLIEDLLREDRGLDIVGVEIQGCDTPRAHFFPSGIQNDRGVNRQHGGKFYSGLLLLLLQSLLLGLHVTYEVLPIRSEFVSSCRLHHMLLLQCELEFLSWRYLSHWSIVIFIIVNEANRLLFR
jgi:hypothetical protein